MEDIKIYSEEVRDVLSTPPKTIFRWGNTIMFGFILMLLFLSWIIKYPDVVIAQAVLTTYNPPQKEFAKTTGKIDTIFVENFDEVIKNQPIAIIENTANHKDVFYLKSVVDTITVNKNSFYFPLNDLPILFLGEIEASFSNFENNYILYSLNKELQPYKDNSRATKFSISELKSRLQNLLHQKDLNEKELFYVKKNLERTKSLFNKGVISAQDYENRELEYLQAERDYKNIGVTISEIRETISNTKNISKQSEIVNTREEISLLKNVIQSFNQLKKEIKEWELKYLFKSNINGKVTFMKIWNKNQEVSNNELIFTIIPSNHLEYIAKLQAPVSNSGKLNINQTVNIKLSAYPHTEYGLLKGKIKQISLIPSIEGFYLIDVSLPKKLITTYNKEIEFKQEMQGSAEIITDDLRLIERLFIKLKEVFER